jgi:hypothetical protein
MLEPAGTHAGEPAQLWPRQWRDERGRSRHLRPLEACGLFMADPDATFVKRLAARSLLESHRIDVEQLARICGALELPRRSSARDGQVFERLASRSTR